MRVSCLTHLREPTVKQKLRTQDGEDSFDEFKIFERQLDYDCNKLASYVDKYGEYWVLQTDFMTTETM